MTRELVLRVAKLVLLLATIAFFVWLTWQGVRGLLVGLSEPFV